MRRRKRKRDTIRKPPEPGRIRSKLEVDPRIVFTSGGRLGGMSKAVAIFDESKQRPPVRDPLREIEKLVRVKGKSGEA